LGNPQLFLFLFFCLNELNQCIFQIPVKYEEATKSLEECMWTEQDNLSVTLTTQMEKTIRDEPIKVREGILRHEEDVGLIPSNIELPGMEMTLVNAMSREFTMKSYLAQLKKDFQTATKQDIYS